MAGIYLHIPFCKTRCIYCDFYSTTLSGRQPQYVDALCRELRARSRYLRGEAVRTVYMGGGTPSQLSPGQLQRIFSTLREVYGLEQAEEITLEANPDDLTDSYLSQLSALPINRISMGIQTFNDEALRLLRRRHTARQAVDAVARCRAHGFGNISIDLIYGLPGETEAQWEADIETAVSLGVEHLSAYHLTYETGTPLHQLLMQRRVREVDEEQSVAFFQLLRRRMQAAGYEHYEISNFCRPGFHSRHNSSYWQGVPYLGCGPSAHSFNGSSREWNAASLDTYIRGIERGERAFEVETLSLHTRYNEYVMTRLRTRQGICLDQLEATFGSGLTAYCLKMAEPHLHSRHLERNNGRLKLTEAGIFVSDGIIADLMRVE